MRTLMAMLAMTALLAVPTAAQITSPQLSNANPPRILSGPQAQQRREALLRANGITPPPQGLREVITLTVATPLVGGAQLSASSTGWNPQQNTLSFSHPTAGGVTLLYNADAGVRFLIDCSVSWEARTMEFTYVVPRPNRAAEQFITRVPVSGGRAGIVVPAQLLAGRHRIEIRSDERWFFHSCEIAPVR